MSNNEILREHPCLFIELTEVPDILDTVEIFDGGMMSSLDDISA